MQSNGQQDKMRWILSTVFLTLFVVLVVFTIWAVFLTADGLSATDRTFIVRLFIGEIGIAVITLFYASFNLRSSGAVKTVRQQTASSFYVKSYPRSQHPDFFAEVERLLPQASTITLIGTGLNLLWEKI